ncbi:lysoplasmalogenase-like protein TMEM86A [Sitodiplosis mosellana]|uniref:lysoplasmalogenase-like protein TMEM86A n=1 Tax=Sitodiplosis mosellana TaxID=263140 RepID=UPI0024444C01|nr:lysoplasmalogenase-like protein TMEM86A [Sitodiplosis mosellana]
MLDTNFFFTKQFRKKWIQSIRNMTTNEELINLMKIAGPKMVPFFKAVCVYFVLNAHNHNGECWTTILKCAPIVGLMLFIVLHGINTNSKFSYEHKILTALIFSCLGDALLNHNYFVYGMCAFAVAQLFYIMAFGFQPLKLWIGCVLYSAGVATIFVLWRYLDPIILIGLPLYTILLVTMCWRSIALLFTAKNSGNFLRIICAISSALFVISDTMIAIDKFYSPISNSSVWIMSTYYAAQFGITLSIVDADKLKQNWTKKRTQ